MDFHCMKRKQLQALCKKHRIPANISNLEMANKLTDILKAKEIPVIQAVIKEQEGILSENESGNLVASRKVKKVRFSPDPELIEFTKSPEIKRRSRRNSVCGSDSTWSVEEIVDNAENNKETVGRQGRITRQTGELKLMEADANQEKIGMNALHCNGGKKIASDVDIIDDGKSEVRSGRVTRLRGKMAAEGIKNASKREGKGANDDDKRDEKASYNVHNEKEIVDNRSRVTRSRAQKLTEAPAEEGKKGRKVAKNIGKVAAVRAENDSSSKRMNEGDGQSATDSDKRTKGNGKEVEEILVNMQIAGEHEKVEPQVLLRRSKRKANGVGDSEMLANDIKKHGAVEIKGSRKTSKPLALDGLQVDAEIIESEVVNPGRRAVLVIEEPIKKVEPRRSNRRKTMIESDNFRAENENIYSLSSSVPESDGLQVDAGIIGGEVNPGRRAVLEIEEPVQKVEPRRSNRRKNMIESDNIRAENENRYPLRSSVPESDGLQMDAEIIGSEVNPGRRAVLEIQEPIKKMEPRRSNRRKTMIESDNFSAENKNRYLLRNSVPESDIVPRVSEDEKMVLQPTRVVRRPRRKTLGLKPVSATIDNDSAVENLEAEKLVREPCPVEKESFEVQRNTRSRRNNSKCKPPGLQNKIGEDYNVQQKNKVMKRKRGHVTGEDVVKNNNGNKKVVSSRHGSSGIGKSLSLDVQLSVSKDSESSTNLCSKNIISDVTSVRKTDRKKDEVSNAENAGSSCMNLTNEEEMANSDTNAASKIAQLETGSTVSKDQNSTNNTGEMEKGNSLLEIDGNESIEQNITDTDKIDPEAQVYSQTENSSCNNKIKDTIFAEGLDVSGEAGSAEASSFADSLLLGDQTDVKNDLSIGEGDARIVSRDGRTFPSEYSVMNSDEQHGIFQAVAPIAISTNSTDVDLKGGHGDDQLNKKEERFIDEGINSKAGETREGDGDGEISLPNLFDGEGRHVVTPQDKGNFSGEHSLKDFIVQEVLHSSPSVEPTSMCNNTEDYVANLSAEGGETYNYKDKRSELTDAGERGCLKSHESSKDDGEFSGFNLFDEEKSTWIKPQDRGALSDKYFIKDLNEEKLFPDLPVVSSPCVNYNEEKPGRESSNMQETNPSTPSSVSDTQEQQKSLSAKSNAANTNQRQEALSNASVLSGSVHFLKSNAEEEISQVAERLNADEDVNHANYGLDKEGSPCACLSDVKTCTPNKIASKSLNDIKFQDSVETDQSHVNLLAGKTEPDAGEEVTPAMSRQSWTEIELQNLFGTTSDEDAPPGLGDTFCQGTDIVNMTTSKKNDMDVKIMTTCNVEESVMSIKECSGTMKQNIAAGNLFGTSDEDSPPGLDDTFCQETEIANMTTSKKKSTAKNSGSLTKMKGTEMEGERDECAKTNKIVVGPTGFSADNDIDDYQLKFLLTTLDKECSGTVNENVATESTSSEKAHNAGYEVERNLCIESSLPDNGGDDICGEMNEVESFELLNTSTMILSGAGFDGCESMEDQLPQNKEECLKETNLTAEEDKQSCLHGENLSCQSKAHTSEAEMEQSTEALFELFDADLQKSDVPESSHLLPVGSDDDKFLREASIETSCDPEVAQNCIFQKDVTEKGISPIIFSKASPDCASIRESDGRYEEDDKFIYDELHINSEVAIKKNVSMNYNLSKELDQLPSSDELESTCKEAKGMGTTLGEFLPDDGGDDTSEKINKVESVILKDTSTLALSKTEYDGCEASEEPLTENTGECQQETNFITEDNEDQVIPLGQSCHYDEGTYNDSGLTEGNIVSLSGSPNNLDKLEGCQDMLIDTSLSESLKSHQEMTQSSSDAVALELSDADHQNSGISTNSCKELSRNTSSVPLVAEFATTCILDSQNAIDEGTSLHQSLKASPLDDELTQRKDTDDFNEAKFCDEINAKAKSSPDMSNELHINSEVAILKSLLDGDNMCEEEADELPCSLELESMILEAKESGTTVQDPNIIVAPSEHGSSVCGAASSIEILDAVTPAFNLNGDNVKKNSEKVEEENSAAQMVQSYIQELHFEEKVEDDTHTISNSPASEYNEILEESDVADTVKENIDSESSLSVIFENSTVRLPSDVSCEKPALSTYEDDIAERLANVPSIDSLETDIKEQEEATLFIEPAQVAGNAADSPSDVSCEKPALSNYEDDIAERLANMPSIDSLETDIKEQEEATLFIEPAQVAGNAADSPRCVDVLAEGTSLDSQKKIVESEDGQISSFRELRSTTRKNARTILIHGTPCKSVVDMKENAETQQKRSNMGDITAVRPAKRRALQDLNNLH